MALKVVEMRRGSDGKNYLAFQGESEAEAKAISAEELERRERIAARVLNEKFGGS